MNTQDENIPYRATISSLPGEAQASAKDENDYDSLKIAYVDLKTQLDELDKWHAFDLTDAEGMDIKQQIKAHHMAFNILLPAVNTLESALKIVDNKYKQE